MSFADCYVFHEALRRQSPPQRAPNTLENRACLSVQSRCPNQAASGPRRLELSRALSLVAHPQRLNRRAGDQ